jgi:hypothetical protein
MPGTIPAAGRMNTPRNRRIDVIYEMRVYNCLPNRLPNLLRRFQNHTIKIWERHGIRQAGFWTTQCGTSNNDLTYLIAWESLAEREEKWPKFQADPEWQSARAESEKDGPIVANIVNQFLSPTSFSSVK